MQAACEAYDGTEYLQTLEEAPVDLSVTSSPFSSVSASSASDGASYSDGNSTMELSEWADDVYGYCYLPSSVRAAFASWFSGHCLCVSCRHHRET